MLTAAIGLSNAQSGFAQETEKDIEYNKFIACYKETDTAKKDACYAGAKAFLDKFGSTNDEFVTFVRKRYDTYTKAKNEAALYGRFNASIKDAKAVNSDEAFSSGRDIVAQYPDLIDVPIILASVGFDNAVAKTPNDKFNADAINYAKMAIQKIEAGKTSTSYGANTWTYKTDKFPDGKSNTLGWMNYTIGYIMYYRQPNVKKEALPYLYKATQFNSETKTNSEIYRTIGSWYVDEFIRLDNDRIAKIKAAGDVDTDETKAILAMQKGYADRAVDAYARAYKVASTDAANKAYRDGLLNRVKELYAIRYNKNMSAFDAYMTSTNAKPFADPSTAIVPVVDETPAAAAGATATTMNNSAAAGTPSSGATRTTTAAATTNVKATGTTTAAATKAATKTPVKKTVVKKKGTR